MTEILTAAALAIALASLALSFLCRRKLKLVSTLHRRTDLLLSLAEGRHMLSTTAGELSDLQRKGLSPLGDSHARTLFGTVHDTNGKLADLRRRMESWSLDRGLGELDELQDALHACRMQVDRVGREASEMRRERDATPNSGA